MSYARVLVLAAVLAAIVGTPARAQFAGAENNGGAINPDIVFYLLRDRQVSAANTAIVKVYELRNLSFALDITSSCSAGTAALTIEATTDNVNFFTVDTAVAAATQVKHYNNTTVGATTAVSPLTYRWLRITLATCGASNTGTLTVAAK